MTIGQLVESLMGKACVMYGGFGDCTAFVNKGPKNKIFGKLLTNVGYNSTGNQILYNGMTGEQIYSEIFIGPTYYMRLKHMVKDKINYRAQGPRTMLTRQTVHGRANDGGLRIGEMERDSLIAHGVSAFLTESMMERGDEFYMAVCNKTGTIAIYNSSLNIFLSPMSDGPIKFTGTLDGNMNIINISKYGRSFSIVRVPYAFKLLIQELQTMNIQMRIVTEENIDQLTSMSYSKNIDKLLFKKEVTPESVIRENREDVEEYNKEDITPVAQHGTPGYVEDIVPPTPSTLSTPPPPPPPETKDPKELGWNYLGYIEDAELYESIIVDENGDVTEKWHTNDHENNVPETYPKGWVADQLFYNDKTSIPDGVMIEVLRENRIANNWQKSLEIIKTTDRGKISSTPDTPISPSYMRASPTLESPSPSYMPTDTPDTSYDPRDKTHPQYSPSYDPSLRPPLETAPTPSPIQLSTPKGEGRYFAKSIYTKGRRKVS